MFSYYCLAGLFTHKQCGNSRNFDVIIRGIFYFLLLLIEFQALCSFSCTCVQVFIYLNLFKTKSTLASIPFETLLGIASHFVWIVFVLNIWEYYKPIKITIKSNLHSSILWVYFLFLPIVFAVLIQQNSQSKQNDWRYTLRLKTYLLLICLFRWDIVVFCDLRLSFSRLNSSKHWSRCLSLASNVNILQSGPIKFWSIGNTAVYKSKIGLSNFYWPFCTTNQKQYNNQSSL